MKTEQTQPEAQNTRLSLSPELLLWRADYLYECGYIQQLPLAYWLVELLVPRRFVQIGVHKGVSYFAICQMIDDLQLATGCTGIDPTGDFALPVQNHNDQAYGDFSALVSGITLDGYPQGSIDLLQINGAPDVQSRADVLALCRDRLSPQGVVLVHGINTGFSAPDARAFLRELAGDMPVIRFDHGDGLLVILRGRAPNATLLELAEMPATHLALARVQKSFARLGKMHMMEFGICPPQAQAAAPQNIETALTEQAHTLAHKHTQDLVVLALQLEQLTQEKAEAGRDSEAEMKAMQVEQDRLRTIISRLEEGLAIVA